MNRSFRVSVLVLALSLVLPALASATEVEGTTTESSPRVKARRTQ